jgi:tetratricopeptide (TPR) repeat protein
MIGQKNHTEHLDSLSALIARAELLKNRKEYLNAIKIYEKAMELNPNDYFLTQRMALVTYKSRLPDPLTSLYKAESILSDLKPYDSNDPETLGLAGSINKKLFEEIGDPVYLEKALAFYKHGYYLVNNYYNGINVANIYILKASIVENKAEAFLCFKNAIATNKNVIIICNDLISSPRFDERNDKEYVYQTLAQAYLGLDQNHEVIKLIPTINEVSKGSFDLDTFHEHNSKMIDAIIKFKGKYPDFIQNQPAI